MLDGLTQPTIQLIALPVLMCWFLRLRCGLISIPRGLVFTAMILAVVTVCAGYSTQSVRGNTIFVSQLHGDPHGGASRIFRERLNAALGQISEAETIRVPEVFTTHQEVIKKFENKRGVDALIWGGDRWFVVEFPGHQRLFADDVLEQRIVDLFSMRPVLSVPLFAAPRAHEDRTVLFLREIFSILIEPKDPLPFDLSLTEWRELSLRTALESVAPWPSFAHRAFAGFLLGNLYLKAAFAGDTIEQGSLRCALTVYLRALRFLNQGDNPELKAALLNNTALLYALHAQIERNGAARVEARNLLRKAVQTAHERNVFGVDSLAIKIATVNLQKFQNAKVKRRAGRDNKSKGDKKVKNEKSRRKRN